MSTQGARLYSPPSRSIHPSMSRRGYKGRDGPQRPEMRSAGTGTHLLSVHSHRPHLAFFDHLQRGLCLCGARAQAVALKAGRTMFAPSLKQHKKRWGWGRTRRVKDSVCTAMGWLYSVTESKIRADFSMRLGDERTSELQRLEKDIGGRLRMNAYSHTGVVHVGTDARTDVFIIIHKA